MHRILVAATTLLVASAAHAADVVAFDPVEPVAEPVPQRSVLVGGGVGFAPSYEGSDEYRVFGFPIVSYSSGVDGPRRFEFRSVDDIRFHALRFGGLSVGPLAGYTFGRDEDDGDALLGLGDVDGGVVVGGFASYDVEVAPGAVIGADVGISTQVTGDAYDAEPFDRVGLALPLRNRIEENYGYGYTVDFGVSGEFDLTPRLNLATRVGAEYASEEYMRTFFGVNPGQSASAALLGNAVPAFGTVVNPTAPALEQAVAIDGQIKNVYANVSAAFDVTDRFEVRAGLGYSRLLGDAADSPVTVSDDQFTGSLGVGYRFRF